MSSKPQAGLEAGRAAGADSDTARTVPGTHAATDEDERDTLRAPPRRSDETPVVVPSLGDDALRSSVGLIPAPPPLGMDAFRSSVEQMRALAPPAAEPPSSNARRVGPPPLPPQPPPLPPTRQLPPPLPPSRKAFDLGTGQLDAPDDPAEPSDDAPTLRPAAGPDPRDDDDARPISTESPFVNLNEIRIPPLPVPKDLAELVEAEGASDSSRPSVNELRPPTYVSSLSPAERAARMQQPLQQQPGGARRPVLAGLAIAAVGVLAIGASALWQPVAEPLLPKRGAAAVREVAQRRSPTPAAQRPSTVLAAAAASTTPPAPTLPSAAEPPSAGTTAIATPQPPRAVVRKREPRAPTIDPATLPETPSRQAVVDAMTALREEIARCAEGRGGVAELMLSVDGSGSVLHAKLLGDYAGTAQGSCIALAARKARFAPFRQARFSVRYPVAL